MKKYEYIAIYFNQLEKNHELDTDKLNGLGSEGWELTTVISGKCIFKREIIE